MVIIQAEFLKNFEMVFTYICYRVFLIEFELFLFPFPNRQFYIFSIGEIMPIIASWGISDPGSEGTSEVIRGVIRLQDRELSYLHKALLTEGMPTSGKRIRRLINILTDRTNKVRRYFRLCFHYGKIIFYFKN